MLLPRIIQIKKTDFHVNCPPVLSPVCPHLGSHPDFFVYLEGRKFYLVFKLQHKWSISLKPSSRERKKDLWKSGKTGAQCSVDPYIHSEWVHSISPPRGTVKYPDGHHLGTTVMHTKGKGLGADPASTISMRSSHLQRPHWFSVCLFYWSLKKRYWDLQLCLRILFTFGSSILLLYVFWCLVISDIKVSIVLFSWWIYPWTTRILSSKINVV